MNLHLEEGDGERGDEGEEEKEGGNGERGRKWGRWEEVREGSKERLHSWLNGLGSRVSCFFLT